MRYVVSMCVAYLLELYTLEVCLQKDNVNPKGRATRPPVASIEEFIIEWTISGT